MDNLTPITREEMLLNDEPLAPITREEKILAGEDLNPVTRREYFLKKYRHAGGDVMVEGLSVTENGTYTAPEGKAYSLVEVAVPLPENAYLLKEASGSLVSFSDGADLPMPSFICNIDAVQDLHGYDSPWVGGAGKNKLEVNATTKTIDGVTFTVNEDGSVKVEGTTDTTNVFFNLNYAAGIKSIPVGKWKIGLLSDNPNIGIRAYAPGYLSDAFGMDFQQITVEEDATQSYVQIQIPGSGITVNTTVYPMILSSDETDLTFAPYENICPISGRTEVVTHRTGKNLFGGTYLDYFALPLPQGTVVTASCSMETEPPRITYYDANKNPLDYWTLNSITEDGTRRYKTFTINEDTAYFRMSARNAKEVQIELSPVPTSYEPFGQTYNIQFKDGSNPLTVYGGSLDVVSGELVVDRKTVIFDGSSDENISAYSTSSYRYRLWISEYRAVAESVLDTKLICSKLKTYTKNDIASNSSILYGLCPSDASSAYIIVKANGITTLADFKTWLSQNELQVVYPLVTPQTYQLTPTQIKSLLGNNNAWCSTGDVDIDYFAKEV